MILAALSLSAILASNSPIIQTPARNVAPAGGGGGTPDYAETFNPTGYDLSWTESNNPNEDYTTAPAPLEGAQSLYVNGQAAGANTYLTITASDNVYAFWLLHVVDDPTAYRSMAYITDSGGNTLCDLSVGPDGGGYFQILGGTGSSGTTAITEDTTLRIWFEHEKGTGANGVARLYISTTDTKPAATLTMSNGSTTAQAARFYLGTWASGGGNVIHDNLKIHRTTAFGDGGSLP
jgi:hypothetical protein